DLGRLGDGAELTVPLHPDPRVVNAAEGRNSILWSFPPRQPKPSCRSPGGALWLLDQRSRPPRTWRNTSAESSSVPAIRSTTPPALYGTVRSIVIPGSSRDALVRPTSGPPSVSRASAIFSWPCEAGATTSPAPPCVTAG